MKIVFIAISFFFIFFAEAQESAPIAYIEGQNDSNIIDIDIMRAGFKLKLSNTSYVIKSFYMCWDEFSSIHCTNIQGDSVKPIDGHYNLKKQTPLNTLFTFDNIIASKKGIDYRIPSFYLSTKDIFKKHLTLDNPKICHDNKQRLACYNDGTYVFKLKKGKFTEFHTSDSLVFYDEKEKLFNILNKQSEFFNSDSIIQIKLEKSSVIFKCGIRKTELASISSSNYTIGGVSFKINPGSWMDTIKFQVAEKNFTIEIKKQKIWQWEFFEKHEGSLFYIEYRWKKNTVNFLRRQDEGLKYGMSLHNRFRRGKRIWYLESSYVERVEEENRNIIRSVPLTPSYRYVYNRFGKLRKKKSKGEIKYCNCN